MGNVSFQRENAGSVTGALGNVVAGIQTNIPKKMEESTGAAVDAIVGLEENVVKINTEIEGISTDTSTLLNCLASSWEEFEANINAAWQK